MSRTRPGRGRCRQLVGKTRSAFKLSVGAVKLLDKALDATDDAVAQRTIDDARTELGAFVSTQGWVVPVAGSTTVKAVKAPKHERRKNNGAKATG